MKRSLHNLSNQKQFTADMGYAIPCGWFEVLPGDSIQQATSALIRVSPLNAPVMHKVDVRIHHFFVATRTIWDEFEPFITGGTDGEGDGSSWPRITVNTGTGYAIGSLADYLGLPTLVDDITHSALPFRAYQKILSEWYLDQDLSTMPTISEASGVDTTTTLTLQPICWEKDYLTSARPDPQKGPDVLLPLGTDAPVTGIGSVNQTWTAGPTGSDIYESYNSQHPYANYKGPVDGAGTTGIYIEEDPAHAGFHNIKADLSNATAATINELREAMALQRYAEARARYGSRYVEYLRYLGIRSSDARLQNSEYLGGGRQPLVFSEVLQTGVTTGGATGGVGNLKGHGIGTLRSNRYRRFFEEHGIAMSIISFRPKTMYVQGLSRAWTRSTKEHYWQKELQHIGQQEVLNREVYAAHSSPTGTFGWQDQYDDYRRIESTIAGQMRDSTADFWHMARIFTSDPALNASFVHCNPTDRIYQSAAAGSQTQLYITCHHNIRARRMLAKTGTSYIL